MRKVKKTSEYYSISNSLKGKVIYIDTHFIQNSFILEARKTFDNFKCKIEVGYPINVILGTWPKLLTD
jgi:hypothetical protein